MKTLFSNIPPVRTKHSTFKDQFYSSLKDSDTISIASGYISTDSVTELKKITELNRKNINLVIGMHHFEGFTDVQYQATKYLNDYLTAEGLGNVYICTSFKFHGKVYTFSKGNNIFSSVIGSSNLHSITENTRTYEVDVLLDEPKFCKETNEFLKSLIEKAAVSFNNYHEPNIIEEKNKLLVDHENVEDVGEVHFTHLFNQNRGSRRFKIPLKGDTAPKSNLNVYFGKGRENARLTIPRHWYEAEIIVSADITRSPGYPYLQTFTVITDDGWKFECNTNGTNSKNFRSANDLKILGKWMKGRMEQRGVLKVGGKVTDEVLNTYGRDNFDLISTGDPNLWLLNFGVDE